MVLHFNINAIPQWRSKRGAMGRSAPGHFLGGRQNEKQKIEKDIKKVVKKLGGKK